VDEGHLVIQPQGGVPEAVGPGAVQFGVDGANEFGVGVGLERARGGDDRAFGELTDPYRSELQLHCYRILGSIQDAEDVLQETMLAAWRGLGQYEGRGRRSAPGCTGSRPTGT
jgi:Sigma-70 region 2